MTDHVSQPVRPLANKLSSIERVIGAVAEKSQRRLRRQGAVVVISGDRQPVTNLSRAVLRTFHHALLMRSDFGRSALFTWTSRHDARIARQSVLSQGFAFEQLVFPGTGRPIRALLGRKRPMGAPGPNVICRVVHSPPETGRAENYGIGNDLQKAVSITRPDATNQPVAVRLISVALQNTV